MSITYYEVNMSQSLELARKLLLEPAALDDASLQKLLDSLFSQQIDYADIYFQQNIHESWYLEDSQVKTGSYSIDKGVGVRAISGEKTGFAYTDDVFLTSIEQAAKAAKSIALKGKSVIEKVESPAIIKPLYAAINPIDSLNQQQKIALLEKIDAYARGLDSRVIQVNASLSGLNEVVLVMNANSEIVADVRPLISINVSVIVEQNGQREKARSGGGGRMDYNYFLEEDKAMEYAKEAVDEALLNLEADEAPAGTMPVVLGPGWPGVLLHEAVGHGLEGDFNRKGLSAFSNKLGQKVASSGVTVVDDGTIKNRRGSLTIDDEGTPSQNTVLIEDGKLVNYMQDKLNARIMGMQPTGNCRRESYAHIPMPRMTNTYMLAGNYNPTDIIQSVEKGLYAVNFGGGQVDITSGKFVFSASQAYLIENGKVTRPVKGATLIGNGPDVMRQVSMIGNDLCLDNGIGVCGKEGQSVPVGVGQPTVKIDALTVGGTRKEG
jgi:TldD protein